MTCMSDAKLATSVAPVAYADALQRQGELRTAIVSLKLLCSHSQSGVAQHAAIVVSMEKNHHMLLFADLLALQVGAAGMVINTMGWVEGLGFQLLMHAIQAMQADVVLVVGQDRLFQQLQASHQVGRCQCSDNDTTQQV